MELKDLYRHKGLRKKLVESIEIKGVKNAKILRAIADVPRHFFIDSSFEEFAYKDKPFPIRSGQTISQPFTVAFQTELLDVQKGDKVLEVGTGSGYQTCILLKMGAKVFTIERHQPLYISAKELLLKMGYHSVKFFHGDGYNGLPAFAPFEKILVTAGAPFIPQKLIEQLAIGGRLVIPVGSDATQIMTSVIKISDKEWKATEHGEFSFVPLLEDRKWD